MAPVMSSVTVACCVRSPSATDCSSFIRRRMAAWLASFTRLASCSWRSASRRCASATRERRGLVDARTGAAGRRHRRPAAAADSTPADQRQAAEAASAARPCCRPLQAQAQRFAVGHDRGLRLRAPHQAGRLSRIAPASVRICSYCASRCCSGSRTCGSRVPGRRRSALPSSRPRRDLAEQVQVLAEWPHAALVAPPSAVRNSLALLPMRCVSIASWPTADSSAAAAPPCSLSADTVSVASSRSVDWRSMAFSGLPDPDQRLLLPQHDGGVLLGAVHQRHQRVQLLLQRHAGTAPSPVFRLSTLPASTSLLSCTSGNAAASPSQRLRHRLGQALRLRRGLAGRRHLRGAAAAGGERQHGRQQQAQQAERRTAMTSARCWRASGQAPISGRPLRRRRRSRRRDGADCAASRPPAPRARPRR